MDACSGTWSSVWDSFLLSLLFSSWHWSVTEGDRGVMMSIMSICLRRITTPDAMRVWWTEIHLQMWLDFQVFLVPLSSSSVHILVKITILFVYFFSCLLCMLYNFQIKLIEQQHIYSVLVLRQGAYVSRFKIARSLGMWQGQRSSCYLQGLLVLCS